MVSLSAVLALALTGCAVSGPAPRPPFRATALSIGASMLPAYATAEQVELELCRFSELRPGNTVIYWHDRSATYVHHRLLWRDELTGRWITRGDANRYPDSGLMTADEFVGRTHKL